MLEVHGLVKVLQLAQTVSLPWAVGMAAARRDDSGIDAHVVELLDSPDRSLVSFAQGYSSARARTLGQACKFDGTRQPDWSA